MESRESDRQEHNMGGQPDDPYRDNGPGSQDGNWNGPGKDRLQVGALMGTLVTVFARLVVVGTPAGIYTFGKRVTSRQPNVAIEGKGSGTIDESSHRGGVDFDWATVKISMIQQIIDFRLLYNEDVGDVEDFIYRGMSAGLDNPYSTYYTEEDFRSVNDSIEGTRSGIGTMLSQNRTMGSRTIMKVSEGSPALEVGMQSGDTACKVGDILAVSESLDALVNNYIEGEEGTNVAITVYRADKDKYVDMSITWRKIEVPTVGYSMLDNKINRIAVSEFDVIIVKQFEQVVDKLQKDGMEGLITDLRSNLSGILDSAVKMVDYILPDDLDQYEKGKGKTLIIYTIGKNEKGNVFIISDGHGLRMSIVILVSEGSASASEVFTGVLKDYSWATVVGTTNYGKGIVRNLIPPGSGSAIKVTTAHYYTPNDLDLHGKGIEPDAEMEPGEKFKAQAVAKPKEGDQFQKAVQVLKENK